MKKTLSILALIILIIAALPFVTGLIAKNRFENLATQIQHQNPNIQLKTKYHLGWLSSRAVLSWSLNTPTNTAMPTLQHPAIIHHGPFILFKDEEGKTHFFFGIALLQVQLPELAQNSVFSIDFKKKIFSNFIYIPFNLHYDFRLHTQLQATVNFNRIPLLSLNLDNLGLNANFTHNFNQVQGQFLLENLNLDSQNNGYLAIPRIEINIDHHLEQSVYLGNESIHIPLIDLSIPSLIQLKMQTLASSFAGHREKNDDVDYTLDLSVNNILYDNQSYGPFAFDFEIRDLNFKVLSEVEQKLQQYVNAKPDQANNASELQTTLEKDMRTLLPTLIQPNTEFNLKQLDFSVPSGSIRSNGVLHFLKTPKMLSLDALMQASELQYHLAASQSLTQLLIQSVLAKSLGIVDNQWDPAKILAQLLRLGLVKENNGFYYIDIRVKQSVPYVNELPFNPAVLQKIQWIAPQTVKQ